MADIMVTLSTGPERAPTIKKEKDWADKEGGLYYPLGDNRPLNAGIGDLIYFIREGRLVARAKIEEILKREQAPKEIYTYTGQIERYRTWWVKYKNFELAKKHIPSSGFQGFRYVGRKRKQFEQSF